MKLLKNILAQITSYRGYFSRKAFLDAARKRREEFRRVVDSTLPARTIDVVVPVWPPADHVWTLSLLGSDGDAVLVGIFTSVDAARATLQQNAHYFWEYYYSIAVIEEAKLDRPSALPEAGRYWYRYQDGSYVPIQCPDAYRNIFGWGVA